MTSLISHEELKARYHYCPDSGCFYKRKRDGEIGRGIGYYGNRYATMNIKGKSYLLHRLAWFYVNGEWPKDDIDHINGLTKDNRIENLRCASRKQNSWNRRMAKNNTSGYKGVSSHAKSGLYVAQAKQNGRVIVLGFFSDPKSASAAYEEFALKNRGHFHRDTTADDEYEMNDAIYPLPEHQPRSEKLARRLRRSAKSAAFTATAILLA